MPDRDSKSTTASRATVSVSDSPSSIEGDFYCLRCTYNLRGLSEGGRCPECGLSMSAMFFKEDLARLDPNWMRSLAASTRMPKRAMIAFGLGVLLSPIYFNLPGGGSLPLGQWIFGTLSTSFFFLGVWRFTTPVRSGGFLVTKDPARRRVRVCSIIVTMMMIFDSMVGAFSWGYYWPGLCGFALFSPFGLAGMVGAWAFSTYYFEVCHAIGFDAHEQRVHWYRWLLLGCSFLLQAGVLFGVTVAVFFLYPAVILGFLLLSLPSTLRHHVAFRLQHAKDGGNEGIAGERV